MRTERDIMNDIASTESRLVSTGEGDPNYSHLSTALVGLFAELREAKRGERK